MPAVFPYTDYRIKRVTTGLMRVSMGLMRVSMRVTEVRRREFKTHTKGNILIMHN